MSYAGPSTDPADAQRIAIVNAAASKALQAIDRGDWRAFDALPEAQAEHDVCVSLLLLKHCDLPTVSKLLRILASLTPCPFDSPEWKLHMHTKYGSGWNLIRAQLDFYPVVRSLKRYQLTQDQLATLFRSLIRMAHNLVDFCGRTSAPEYADSMRSWCSKLLELLSGLYDRVPEAQRMFQDEGGVALLARMGERLEPVGSVQVDSTGMVWHRTPEDWRSHGFPRDQGPPFLHSMALAARLHILNLKCGLSTPSHAILLLPTIHYEGNNLVGPAKTRHAAAQVIDFYDRHWQHVCVQCGRAGVHPLKSNRTAIDRFKGCVRCHHVYCSKA